MIKYYHPYNHLLKSGCAEVAAALLPLPLPGRRYCTPPPLQLLLLTTAAPAHLFRPPGFAERTAVVLVQITKLASLEEGGPRLDSSCKAIKNLPQRGGRGWRRSSQTSRGDGDELSYCMRQNLYYTF